MTEFEYFLKENNYEDDLEFQLCDLEMAFNAGKEMQWKPSEEQMEALDFAADCIVPEEFCFKRRVLKELLEQLKKLREK